MNEEKAEQLVKIAKSLIGVPYKYGVKPEETPNFFDCSSFIQCIYKQIGIDLPRSTILQADQGEKVELENIQTGDLLFFHGTQGFYNERFPEGIGHVILYIGDGKTIHAASERIQENPKVVEIGQVEERDLNELMEKLKPLIVIKRFF